jgi:D-lactate dehydrogenase
MDIAVFSTKPYDREFLLAANEAAGSLHRLAFHEATLTSNTTALAMHAQAVCAFVNDQLNANVLAALQAQGVQLIALRCAGFNNVDLAAAQRLNIRIARVPAYSPVAIAEHTVGMMLALNRHLHRAYVRVREANFSLDGLLGFDMQQRTVGIIGTGHIGAAVARILTGFGCRLLAYDPTTNDACIKLGVHYASLADLYAQSDIITLHCPLTPHSRHLIDAHAINQMRKGVMLINTSRGAVVDTRAIIDGLKSGAIGHLGLDVYEEEGDLFFENLSEHVLQDDLFARLLTFPNVLITGHQAFFTREALTAICTTTIDNISLFAATGHARHEVSTERLA